jgi:FtsH-binding integral membrane protein
VPAVVGIALLICWIIFLRATMMSMGWLGIILGGALLACLIWLLVDIGWLSLDSSGAITWVVLLVLSFILATVMSCSHIRRRLTGQVDVDEVDD